MSRFREVFSTPHVVLPIVHVGTHDQAARNVRIARDAGADGAFLISPGNVSDDDSSHYIYEAAVEAVYGKSIWQWVNGQ